METLNLHEIKLRATEYLGLGVLVGYDAKNSKCELSETPDPTEEDELRSNEKGPNDARVAMSCCAASMTRRGLDRPERGSFCSASTNLLTECRMGI